MKNFSIVFSNKIVREKFLTNKKLEIFMKENLNISEYRDLGESWIQTKGKNIIIDKDLIIEIFDNLGLTYTYLSIEKELYYTTNIKGKTETIYFKENEKDSDFEKFIKYDKFKDKINMDADVYVEFLNN